MNIPLSVVVKGLVDEYVTLMNTKKRYYDVRYNISKDVHEVQGKIRILSSKIRNYNAYFPDELVSDLKESLALYQSLRKDYQYYENVCNLIQEKIDELI